MRFGWAPAGGILGKMSEIVVRINNSSMASASVMVAGTMLVRMATTQIAVHESVGMDVASGAWKNSSIDHHCETTACLLA